MDTIGFENTKPFVIADFRNAMPPLTRAGIRRLAPQKAQRAAGGGSANKLNRQDQRDAGEYSGLRHSRH